MADEMTRQEFKEFMAEFAQRLDTRFDRIDDQFTQTHEAFNDLKTSTNAQFTQTHQAFNDLKASTNAQFTQTHGAVNDLKHSMNVQFEETRQHFKLSLEAVEGLGEKTERGFAAMHSEHAEHKALLEQAIHHVRERLENVERYHPGE